MADDDDPGQEPEDDATEDKTVSGEEKPDAVFDEDRAKAKIAKANREAASLRQRMKELEPLAAKAKELEEASKSEQEKLTERTTSAEDRATKAEAQVARLTVALNKGLTLVQAKRLIGDTEDDLEKDADELLASFKQDDDGPEPTSRRPRERLRPGAAPSADADESSPAELAKQVSRGW